MIILKSNKPVIKVNKIKNHYIFSLSGGKDSTMALYLAINNNLPIDEVVCAILPFEEPEMYEHLNNIDNWLIEKTGKRIIYLYNDKSINKFMGELVKRGKHKGKIRGFPLKGVGFCWISRDYKIVPLQKFKKFYEKENNCNVITYKGFATDEKNKNRALKVDEYISDPKKYSEKHKEAFPLADFGYTEEMCREELKEIGLSSPVHFMNNRSGCWNCQKARKKERIKNIIRFPERIINIEEWNNISGREIYPDITLNQLKKEIQQKGKNVK